MKLLRDWHIRLLRVVDDEQRISRVHWVESGAHQIDLAVLQRPGGLHLALYAYEHRSRVDREQRRQVVMKLLEVDAVARRDRRHPGATVMARNGHAIDNGVGDARHG